MDRLYGTAARHGDADRAPANRDRTGGRGGRAAARELPGHETGGGEAQDEGQQQPRLEAAASPAAAELTGHTGVRGRGSTHRIFFFHLGHIRKKGRVMRHLNTG